jgi:hypothetical protein
MLSSGWKGPLRCVVHFVETNSGTFRYRVLPVGARLRTPGEGTSLAEWADRQAWARSTEAERVLTNTEERVDPKSVVPGPDGLKTILKSGRFRVSGSVFFSPLQPFNPSPEIPRSGEGPTMMAEQEFEYRHPTDTQ